MVISEWKPAVLTHKSLLVYVPSSVCIVYHTSVHCICDVLYFLLLYCKSERELENVSLFESLNLALQTQWKSMNE